mgnify:CR=1 FL=1
MKILVLNSGSSSLKYQLVDMDTKKALAEGICEIIGIYGVSTYKVPAKNLKLTDKIALEKINYFPIGIKSGEDLITWVRLAIFNEIAYTLAPLSVFIQDAAHTYDDKPNRIPENNDIVGLELIKLYKSHKEIPGLKHYVSNWFKMRASIYLRLGNRKEALHEIKKSIFYHPMSWKLYIYIIITFFPLKFRTQIFKRFGVK